MANNYVNEARNFLRQFRSLVAFAEAIEDASKLDDQVASLHATKATLEEAIAKHNEKINSQKLDVDTANQAVEEARTHAAEIIKSAHDQAHEILAKANEKIKENNQKSTKALSEAAEKLKEANKKLSDANTELLALAAKKDEILTEIANLRARIA